MIYFFTDFSSQDFYVGQLHSAVLRRNPDARLVDLFHHADPRDIEAAARLLARLSEYTASDAILVAVVDPGVGGSRRPLMIQADGRWLVGPDNGLFSFIVRQAQSVDCREINWRPANMSVTFHGRDLFAPVAAMLERGEMPDSTPCEAVVPDWPKESGRIIYRDHFGNLMTGLTEKSVTVDTVLAVNGEPIRHAERFGAVDAGDVFWMINSIGLVEIAANQADASACLGVSVGDEILFQA